MTKDLQIDHRVTLKKKRTVRIIAGVVLGLVLALSALIIAGACITVDLKPSVIGTPSQVTIYDQSTQHGRFSSDEEKYALFMDKFNEMFKANYLVALFSGRLGNYTISSQSEAPRWSEIETSLKNGTWVQMTYREPQQLKYNDGKPCSNVYSTNKQLTFSTLAFAIEEEDEVKTLSIYVKIKFTDDKNAVERALTISQKANTSLIYSALDDLETL